MARWLALVGAATMLGACATGGGGDARQTGSRTANATNFVDISKTRIITAEQVMRDRERAKRMAAGSRGNGSRSTPDSSTPRPVGGESRERDIASANPMLGGDGLYEPSNVIGVDRDPTDPRDPVTPANPYATANSSGTDPQLARPDAVATTQGGAQAPILPDPDFAADGAGGASNSPPAGPVGASGKVWAVLLSTTTGDQHAQQALAVAAQIHSLAPQIPEIWLHATERGSMVLCGRFASVEDEAAQERMKFVKTVNIEGRTPFMSVRLVPITLNATAAANAIHPNDLRSLRKQHPRTNPLYTIDVAVWIAEEGDESSWSDCRRRAESYAAQLRTLGHEAWFYHDQNQRVSSVTVGKFDRTSVDEVSGLYSADMTRLMERFPVRLTNGEPFIDPQTREEQKPRVVQVPMTLD